jgi:thiol-disulfide isomerase/thioredoxin
MEELMNETNRFTYFQEFVRNDKPHRFSALLRSSIRGLILSAIVTFLFAAFASGVLLAQDDFDSVYDKARLNFQQGKYEEALALYKRANGMKQNSNLDCLWGMAETFGKLGAHKNALQTCDRMIELSGDNLYFQVKGWNMRGNELSAAAAVNPDRLDENKLREAETAYREVLKLSAINMAHYNLGITLIRLNRVNEGIAELKTYIQRAEEEDIAEKARKIIQEPRRAVENFVPDFSIITSEGDYISADELRGKVILIDFWGSWCKPCLSAIPFLSQLAKKYRNEGFMLVSVDVNDEEAKWRAFIAQNKMNWTHTRDSNGKIPRLFQITGFPTYILIDHEGIIRYRGMGSGLQTESDISDKTKKALKALTASPNRQKEKPVESAAVPAPRPQPASRNDSGTIAPAPGVLNTDIAARRIDEQKMYVVRIPKPKIEVTTAEGPNSASQLQSQISFYRLRVRNWASLPDDLFAPSKDLMACSANAMSPVDAKTTRLEIIIHGEQGQLLRAYCNPPSPNILENLMFAIPNQIRPERIYLTLKDRLTGNSVQSDSVYLP